MTAITEKPTTPAADGADGVDPNDADSNDADSNDAVAASLQVGARVRLVQSADDAAGRGDTGSDTGPATDAPLGRVVDDYAGTLDGDTGGRTWAVPHRWAVALDDGRLVFRDDDDLEVVEAE